MENYCRTARLVRLRLPFVWLQTLLDPRPNTPIDHSLLERSGDVIDAEWEEKKGGQEPAE